MNEFAIITLPLLKTLSLGEVFFIFGSQSK
jgi:hypothetical protein